MLHDHIICGVLIAGGLGCVAPPDTSEYDEVLQGPKFDHELWVTTQNVATSELLILDDHGRPTGETVDLPGAGPHITTFPGSGDFAYVGGMVDGKGYVVDANDRTVVTSFQLGPTLAHQIKPSPDGTVLLASVLSTKSVVKIIADEHNRTWTVGPSVSLASFGKPPVCTIFRNDGKRAYASMNPSGIAVIDVDTMTVLTTIDTDGFIACGMIKSKDGGHAVIAASGSGGHIYTLDMTNDTLADRGSLGAGSWHSFNMTEDEKLGFGTSPLTDEVILIDLTTTPVTKTGSVVFTAIPTPGANQPDALGGGEMLGKTVPVTLRAAGKISFLDAKHHTLEATESLADPATFNPATCEGCAIHGVTQRPTDSHHSHGGGGQCAH